ncbi:MULTISPECIES: hypothetical protein [unclassified Bradyrhizobium]|nr:MULTISPECIES: hypothetical protein [unclassified Bradyrhizobium]MBB4259064.1 hypothetical protein [Bradyrhizobium sp. CIR3A]NYG44314.1 hypothetical protein [Bradyrhizobium sp. IAR9]
MEALTIVKTGLVLVDAFKRLLPEKSAKDKRARERVCSALRTI